MKNQRPEPAPEPPPQSHPTSGRRLLITSGPTHEPIDAVRYIGNRSSGRVGMALADEGVRRGWDVTLLLGPVSRVPSDSRVRVRRFRTCAELQGLLGEEAGTCDVLVMAAAVADYRPTVNAGMLGAKFRRTGAAMTIELESTPDLIAGVSAGRRPGQTLVAFALEPREEMIASGLDKLRRKGVDMVVANPLETMDGETIEAVLLHRDGTQEPTARRITKDAFAAWLLERVEARMETRIGGSR